MTWGCELYGSCDSALNYFHPPSSTVDSQHETEIDFSSFIGDINRELCTQTS